MSNIGSSDQIIVLDKGEVIEQGVHKDLVKKDGKYKNYLIHKLVYIKRRRRRMLEVRNLFKALNGNEILKILIFNLKQEFMDC